MVEVVVELQLRLQQVVEQEVMVEHKVAVAEAVVLE
jgi:hypothetical protein